MRPRILFVLLSILILESGFIGGGPDLAKKEDLKALGMGKIIEKNLCQMTKSKYKWSQIPLLKKRGATEKPNE